MFLVIPLVEFLYVLGVDIDVHHENPATFLCHVSVSSMKRSRHRFASSHWHPVLTPGAQVETRDHQLGSYLRICTRNKRVDWRGTDTLGGASPPPPYWADVSRWHSEPC